jgi:membrane protease YdiL (CAAX protease family)
LLLVLVPNLVLTGVGLGMSGAARQVAETQSAVHFGSARFLRQVGLCAFLPLPTGVWLVRQRAGWVSCCWGWERPGRAVLMGALLGVGLLFLRGRPFEAARLSLTDTWWALSTYAVVALVEETLYRGSLQGRLGAWLSRGGEPLVPALIYAAVQLLPMALLFGGAMLAAGHVAAPATVHLAWNWASVIHRQCQAEWRQIWRR